MKEKLALQIIDNKVYFFIPNRNGNIKEVIKIYEKKVNIDEFLKLRKSIWDKKQYRYFYHGNYYF